LPELIAFYEDHAEHRDQFEILAIHDDAVKSFAELDRKLVTISKQNWRGKPLPFPILIDGKKKTHELYGIHSWPTGVLIDPEGKVVGEASIGGLEAKLPPLPAQTIWARHRDIKKNVFWSFQPNEYTLPQLAQILKRWTGCDVVLDLEAIRACGLTTNGPLPGVVLGSRITLRSIDELLLAPHGLGLVPSAQGQTLHLTRQVRTQEPLSYSQKLRAAELADRLDRALTGSAADKMEPVQIKNQSLFAAIKLINHEYDLPLALDARAMRTGTLNPQAAVNGKIDPAQLRSSLSKMIAPLGLILEVRHEVVILTPK